MSAETAESPLPEQEICVTCGLCCDGTLFDNAVLMPGEHGTLPEKIEQQYHQEGDMAYFKLPCAYFHGKCTIYDQPRAVICGAFRCQLLEDVEKGRTLQAQALDKVASTLKFRDELYQLYRQVFGEAYPFHFQKLLLEVSKIAEITPQNDPHKAAIDLLRIKCTIFETLLIKTYKSRKNFDRLVSTTAE